MTVTERGRFAPSPTGELHLGNARTALLAWLWARSVGADFALRVEDLDRPRVRPGLAGQQLDELRWLGLDWDGEVLYQSARAAFYDQAIAQLDAYPCFCSRAEIAAASAPHAGEESRYAGTCKSLTLAQRSERERTRAPHSQSPLWKPKSTVNRRYPNFRLGPKGDSRISILAAL